MSEAPLWDFVATLHLVPTVQGGLSTPLVAGGGRYRPLFALEGQSERTTCFVDVIEDRQASPPANGAA